VIGNLRDTEFYSVAYDDRNHIVFGGAQDTGSSEQTAAGSLTWNTPSASLQGDGNTQAIDNSNATTIRYSMADDFSFFFRRTPGGALSQVLLAAAATPGTPDSGLNAADQGTIGNSFFIIPYVLDTVAPSRMMIGLNGLYEDAQTGAAHATGNIIANI